MIYAQNDQVEFYDKRFGIVEDAIFEMVNGEITDNVCYYVMRVDGVSGYIVYPEDIERSSNEININDDAIKMEYTKLREVLKELKELAKTIDGNEDSIFHDQQNLAESCKREIIDTLLELDI